MLITRVLHIIYAIPADPKSRDVKDRRLDLTRDVSVRNDIDVKTGDIFVRLGVLTIYRLEIEMECSLGL